MERVLDILLKEGCLQWEERIEVGNKKNIDQKCQSLLEILIRRGGKCYKDFLDVLKASGNQHIAEEIEQTCCDQKDDIENLSDGNGENADESINELRKRIAQLISEMGEKKERLRLLRDQQRRALDDLRKQKDKNNEKENTIRNLEKKNNDLEREVIRLKITIENIQKQLKRSEEDKKRTANEHLKAIQSLEKKQDATQKTCEKLCENFTNFTKEISKSFQVLHDNHKMQQPKEHNVEISKNSPSPLPNLRKQNTRQGQPKVTNCNFSENAGRNTKNNSKNHL